LTEERRFTGAFFFGAVPVGFCTVCAGAPSAASSGFAASPSPATSRGGASSGRGAGSIGATAGNASQTFHWQIR
jgi:hypothetical protein